MNAKALYFFSGFDKDADFPSEIAQSLQKHIILRDSLVSSSNLRIASVPI